MNGRFLPHDAFARLFVLTLWAGARRVNKQKENKNKSKHAQKVINYDFPVGAGALADYVHRIGRTGRGDSAEGTAITLLTAADGNRHAGGLIAILEDAGQPVPPELDAMRPINQVGGTAAAAAAASGGFGASRSAGRAGRAGCGEAVGPNNRGESYCD